MNNLEKLIIKTMAERYEFYDLGNNGFAYDDNGMTFLESFESDMKITVDYRLKTIFINYGKEITNSTSRLRNRFFKEVNGFEEIADTRSLDKAIDNGYFETEYGEYWEVELD